MLFVYLYLCDNRLALSCIVAVNYLLLVRLFLLIYTQDTRVIVNTEEER
jgi:hypothetical protein